MYVNLAAIMKRWATIIVLYSYANHSPDCIYTVQCFHCTEYIQSIPAVSLWTLTRNPTLVTENLHWL